MASVTVQLGLISTNSFGERGLVEETKSFSTSGLKSLVSSLATRKDLPISYPNGPL